MNKEERKLLNDKPIIKHSEIVIIHSMNDIAKYEREVSRRLCGVSKQTFPIIIVVPKETIATQWIRDNSRKTGIDVIIDPTYRTHLMD